MVDPPQCANGEDLLEAGHVGPEGGDRDRPGSRRQGEGPRGAGASGQRACQVGDAAAESADHADPLDDDPVRSAHALPRTTTELFPPKASDSERATDPGTGVTSRTGVIPIS